MIFSAHGVAPQVHEEAGARQARHHRRHLPAGHQGPQGSRPLRQGGLRHPPDRSRGPRGGHRHQRRGARAHHPRRRPGRRCERRGPRPVQGRLALPDHALGRRDDGDRRRAQGAVPPAPLPAQRRHLLRHAEPPDSRSSRSPRTPTWSSSSAPRTPPTPSVWSRSPCRRRQATAYLVDFAERDRRGLAGRRHHGRRHLRRLGAGGAGRRSAGVAGRARLRGRGARARPPRSRITFSLPKELRRDLRAEAARKTAG